MDRYFNTSHAGGLEHRTTNDQHAVCSKRIKVRIGLLGDGTTGPWVKDEPTGMWPACPKCEEK
jgi:hypothetical protein